GQYAATPIVSGVTQVAGAGDLVPLDPAPTQVTFLRTQQGFSAGYIQRIGIGSAIVLADPLVLCNGYLEKSDNGRLLADLLGTVDTGARVAFDGASGSGMLCGCEHRRWRASWPRSRRRSTLLRAPRATY